VPTQQWVTATDIHSTRTIPSLRLLRSSSQCLCVVDRATYSSLTSVNHERRLEAKNKQSNSIHRIRVTRIHSRPYLHNATRASRTTQTKSYSSQPITRCMFHKQPNELHSPPPRKPQNALQLDTRQQRCRLVHHLVTLRALRLHHALPRQARVLRAGSRALGRHR
jgi:hypothetical protein